MSGSEVISEQDIVDAGYYARKNTSQIYNNCWDIASKVEMYLNDKGLPWDGVGFEDYGVLHVRVGYEKVDVGIKHYLFRIKGEYIEGAYRNDSYVWVDAAFDQFCDDGRWDISYGRQEDIDDVRIMEYQSDTRISQYTRIGDMMSL
jgi:hypothetical protein